MEEAKRQGREKSAKIEQRKVQGLEWGPQVEQTAFLASPIYIEQTQGEEKTYKKRSRRAGGLSVSHACSFFLSLSSLHLLGRHALTPQGCIFLCFLNKTDLSKNYNTDCLRAVMRFNVCRFKSLLWRDRTEEITLPWQGDGDTCSGRRCWGPAPYTYWPSGGILIVQHSPEFLFPRLILQFPSSSLRYQVSFR